MSVRFRKRSHAEMLRYSEGPLARRYKKLVENWNVGHETAVLLTAFIAAIIEDRDIDNALARTLPSPLSNESMVILSDLSSVPFALLDKFQVESGCASNVDMVLMDERVEAFVRMLPTILKAVSRANTSAHLERHVEVITVTRLFVNALGHSGDKVFVLSNDLAWALKETELRKYPADDLRLPYRTIYIEIPDGYRVFNHDTGWHNVIGCYVSESEREDGKRWRILMVGESKDKDNAADDALFFFAIDLSNGNTVEQCLSECRDTHKSFNSLAYAGVPLELFDEVEDENEKLFRLIMNVVLYVTNPDADAVFTDASPEYRALKDRLHKAQGTKKERIKAQMRTVSSRPRIVLGGSLVVDRHQDDPEGLQGTHRGISDGRHWKVRTLVRGHWRSQPCGKGHMDRRPTWIKPHWAGPQLAPVTQKVTEVR